MTHKRYHNEILSHWIFIKNTPFQWCVTWYISYPFNHCFVNFITKFIKWLLFDIFFDQFRYHVSIKLLILVTYTTLTIQLYVIQLLLFFYSCISFFIFFYFSISLLTQTRVSDEVCLRLIFNPWYFSAIFRKLCA